MLMVLIILLLLILGGPFLYFKMGFGKKFYHDVMGWHVPTDEEWVPDMDISFHSHCKYCGKEIMQDSQGNWF